MSQSELYNVVIELSHPVGTLGQGHFSQGTWSVGIPIDVDRLGHLSHFHLHILRGFNPTRVGEWPELHHHLHFGDGLG